MTKFCRRCMQQCQHENSQFCTVPGSPANHEGTTRAHPGNWKRKVKFFPVLCLNWLALRTSMRYRQQCEIPMPGQLQYPGYATAVECCSNVELTESVRPELTMGPNPLHIGLTSFPWWMLPGTFHCSSASVYHCQHKLKNKLECIHGILTPHTSSYMPDQFHLYFRYGSTSCVADRKLTHAIS